MSVIQIGGIFNVSPENPEEMFCVYIDGIVKVFSIF